MSEERKKPGVAFWATVVVSVALVAYPLSFGPACWFAELDGSGQAFDPDQHNASNLYWPIGWTALNGPQAIRGVIGWYATLRHRCVAVPTNREGDVNWIARS